MAKDKRFTARISEDDLARIKQKAQQANRTLTDYVIACALRQKITMIEGIPELVKELKAHGRNLNQLATLANMGRLNTVNFLETQASYEMALTKLGELLERLN